MGLNGILATEMVTLWWIYGIHPRNHRFSPFLVPSMETINGNHRFSPSSPETINGSWGRSGIPIFPYFNQSVDELKKAQGLWENPVLTWTFHIAQPTGDIICPTNTCLTVIFEIPKTGRGDQPNLWRIAVLLGKWRKMIRNHGIQGKEFWGNPPIIPEDSLESNNAPPTFCNTSERKTI